MGLGLAGLYWADLGCHYNRRIRGNLTPLAHLGMRLCLFVCLSVCLSVGIHVSMHLLFVCFSQLKPSRHTSSLQTAMHAQMACFPEVTSRLCPVADLWPCLTPIFYAHMSVFCVYMPVFVSVCWCLCPYLVSVSVSCARACVRCVPNIVPRVCPRP